MSSIVTAVRRSLYLVVVAAAVGGAYAWWRDRQQASLAPAEWPPLEPPRSATAASFVNSLVDAPEARSSDGTTGGWVAPLDDGSCPIDHPIKANDNSGIFHVPDGRFYERTNAERCYSSAEAATADGYRQAKH